MWFKADALVLNDGDPVATWTDSSGYGRSATEATNRPTYRASVAGLNSLPAVQFDGTNDTLATASVDLTERWGLTVYAAFQAQGSASSQVMCEFSSNVNTGANRGFGLFRETPDSAVFTHSGAGAHSYQTDGLLGTTKHIVRATANRLRRMTEVSPLALDGSVRAYNALSVTTASANNINSYGNQPLYIGSRAGTSLFLNGYLAELIVYGREHSQNEARVIEQYLANKFAITLATPTGVLVADGDSQVDGNSGAYVRCWPDYIRDTLSGSWVVVNHGFSGSTTHDNTTDAADVDRWFTPSVTRNVVAANHGTNDEFHPPYATEATVESRITSYVRDRRAAGWRPVECKPLPNSNAGWHDAGVQWAIDWPLIGAWMDTNAASLGMTVANVTSDPRIGNEGDQNDATYYSADLAHLNAVGHAVFANKIVADMVTANLAARFAPTDLSGCVGWWDAQQITGLTNGDPVATWTNLATGIGNFTAAGTARPTYTTGVTRLNAPVVRFDGTTDIMSTAAYDLSATTAVSVIVVFGAVTAGTQYIMLERSTNYATNTGGFLVDRLALNTVIVAQKGAVGENSNTSAATVTTGYAVSASVFDRSLAGASENLVTLNGVVASQVGAFNNTSHFGATDAFFLGGRSGGTFLLPGDICEVVIFNRALSKGEMRRIEIHLACKWGLF